MWDYHEFVDAQWYRWLIDGVHVYLRKNGEEWRTQVRPLRPRQLQCGLSGPDPCEAPEYTDFTISVAPGSRAALKPVMPDRPFLVSAINTVTIVDGASAEFFVDLPLFLRLETQSGILIREIAPFILSNTWFGDKTTGRLCYSIKTNLDPLCRGESEPQISGCPPFQSMVRCAITVLNHSRMPLLFQQLAVYTELLRIREEAGYLYTDRILVDSLPDGSLNVSVPTLPLPRGSRLIAAARMRQGDLLVRRGIDFLRSITGM